MSDAILTIERLSSGYGDFQALFDVSLSLKRGTVLSLVGANGAGKTTLFKAILGLLPRQRSMVTYKGEPIGHLRPERLSARGLAMVPEGRRLFRSLTVDENLRIAADYGRKGDWTIDRIYRLFPVIDEKRKAPAGSLSGGQQQMVAIGRALAANPEVVLFDEISLGLAPIVVNDLYRAMPEIMASGISAILVEQDVQRARSLASDLVCMREGRVVLAGRASDFSVHDITVAYFGESA